MTRTKRPRGDSGPQSPKRPQARRRIISSSPPTPRRNPPGQAAIDAMDYQPGPEVRPKRAKPKSKPRQKKAVEEPTPPSIPSGISADDYSNLTDPTLITVPDPTLINPALLDAWKVNPKHKMCVLFDAVNPCRQFKRDATYDDDLDDPFAEYDPDMERDGNVTDTDEGDGQPYAPVKYSNVYHFQITFSADLFLSWDKDETLLIKVGTLRGASNPRMCYRRRYIPVVYAQVLHQLCTEVSHANINKGHEAQRRAAYADQVTDLFAHEIYERRDLSRQGSAASNWRSKVLTPIIQRQIAGVPDAYRPAVHAGILDPEDDDPYADETKDLSRAMTIGDATLFYLSRDPTDPALIPEYRHNLLYTRELRWYLATLLGHTKVDDIEGYNMSIFTQDQMENVDKWFDSEDGGSASSVEGEDDEPPPMGALEIFAILTGGLQGYYKVELDAAESRHIKRAKSRFTDAMAELTELATGPASAKPQRSTPLRESTVDGVKHTEITQDTTNDDDEDGAGDLVGPDAIISVEDIWHSAQGRGASPGSVGEEAAVAGHLTN